MVVWPLPPARSFVPANIGGLLKRPGHVILLVGLPVALAVRGRSCEKEALRPFILKTHFRFETSATDDPHDKAMFDARTGHRRLAPPLRFSC